MGDSKEGTDETGNEESGVENVRQALPSLSFDLQTLESKAMCEKLDEFERFQALSILLQVILEKDRFDGPTLASLVKDYIRKHGGEDVDVG